MKISNKLLFGLLAIAFLTVGVGLISFTTNNRVIVSTNHLLENAIAERQAATATKSALVAVRNGVQMLVAEKYRAALEPDKAVAEKTMQSLQSEIEKQLRNFRKQLEINREIIIAAKNSAASSQLTYSDDDKEELQLIGEIEREFTVFTNLLEQHLLLDNADYKQAEAFEREQFALHYKNRLLPLVNQYESNASQAVEEEAQNIRYAMLEENKIILLSTIIALILAFIVGIYLANSISKPIRLLKQAVLEFGSGSLDARIVVDSADEIGILGNAFNEMAEQIESRAEKLKIFNEQLSRELGERERAEQALRQSEAEYTALVKATSQYVWSADKNGQDSATRLAWEELTGQKLNDGKGWNWLDFLHVADRDSTLKSWQQAFETKSVCETEFRVLVKSGEYRWFVMRGVPIVDNEAVLQKWVGTMSDITERKQVEESLRRRDQELSDFLENATVGLHWADSDGNIIWANKAELDLLGYTLDEFVGHNIADFYVDKNVIADILDRQRNNETIDDFEAQLQSKDGSIKHVLINSNVLWENGKFIRTRCFTRDITERKAAEEALRQSEASYRQLADAMPQIVWTARPDGYADYYNQRSFEYSGKTYEQIDGWNWENVLHPADLEKSIELWNEAIKSGEKYKAEYRLRRACDGEYRWHLAQAVPIRDEENQIIKWFGTCTDIHEQKNIEEELRHIQGTLESRVAARTVDLEQANHALKQEIIVRERIEKALSDSTKREREMIENALSVICTVDASGHFTGVNPASYKMWGYQPDELVGRSYMELVAQEDVAKTIEVSERILSGEKVTNFENRFRHKNGTLVHLMWTSHWSEDEKSMFAVAHDITERKQIENSLRESERKYRELIENANDILYTLDLTGRFTSINRAGEQLTGYTRAEALQMTINDVIAPKDVPLVRKRMADNIKGTGMPNFELDVITKSGSTVTFDISSRLIVQEGVTVGIQGIGRDITERKQAEKHLLESELRYRRLFGSNPNPVFVYDAETFEFLEVNEEAIRHYGYSYEEFQRLNVKNLLSPEESGEFLESSVHSEEKIEKFRSIKHQKKDGTPIEVDIAVQSINFAGKRARLSLITDVTEQKRADAALRESEYKLRTLLGSMREGLLQVDIEDRILFVNDCFCEMVGYTFGELMGTKWSDLVFDDDGHDFIKQVNKRRPEGLSDNYEICLRKKSGEMLWVIVGGAPILDAENVMTGSMGVFTDITERKLSEKQLLHDAFHDGLTGLANRTLFIDHVQMTIERTRRDHSELFAVLFLDFDRFKVINDSLGHSEGDNLLKQIARRLELSLRSCDLVARLGGDEFTVLLNKLGDSSVALRVAERIQKNLEMPFEIGGGEIFISASIGIALSTTGHDRAEDMLRDADIAMYRAKARGRGQHQVFDQAMHEQALAHLRIETEMRQAVEQNEFCLLYQPIYQLKTGQIVGFESLVRWKHAEFGIISPNDFIPVAEENGLIIPLGQWILHESCRQLRQWQLADPSISNLTVSVNLSFKQFLQVDLAEQVAATLKQTGLDPRCLKLEITESHLMENSEKAVVIMNRLCALGVELSLDDFGTGYSSLSYLHRLPVNYLKVDRSFVMRMIEGEENREIVSTIIKLGRNLKMKVIAEGIETAAQHDQLIKLNCEFGQGYLFSKPLEAIEAEKFIGNNLKNLPVWSEQTFFDSQLSM